MSDIVDGRAALVASLKRIGALRSRSVEEAFRAVDQHALLPPVLVPLAYADAPVPSDERLGIGVCPSPQILAAMLEVLELESGVRTAVVGGGPYPATLVAALVGNAPVSVVEPDAGVRERIGLALRNRENLSVTEALDGEWDRIWRIAPGTDDRTGGADLADMGYAVSWGDTPDGPAILKRIRSGAEFLTLSIQRLPAQDRSRAFDAARSLALDDLMVRAWQGRVEGAHDRHFAESVDETFAGGPLDAERPSEGVANAAARKVFHIAFVLQTSGELRRAADMYGRSIAVVPSAEAYTFLGWTYSFEGRPDDAIEACRSAIATDPTFGNPYNDIGAYLIELGRHEEAIPWLEKAIGAPRYCCPFYAHTNLGRVYLTLGRRELARKHFIEALKAKPDYEPAREMLRRIDRAFDYFA